MIGIYKITNPKGKVYIGQSINLENRLTQYRCLTNCKPQVKLFNSLKKYGTENHLYEIIEICKQHELNERERYYQEVFNSVNKGLNCRLTGTLDKCGKNSLESNKKRSNTMKGKNRGSRPDVSERNKIVHKGKTITEEHRRRISQKLKGKKRGYTGVRGEALRRPVIQWNKTGSIVIKEWESITEAAKFYNRGGGDIIRVASGKGKTCAGFYWTYKESAPVNTLLSSKPLKI